ncbi:phage antirepressor KilAC domain-containing protein [Acetobacter sicerae]|uniref:phage antirepressor KilAC domain-containing protein n=1 Tax=Acetobacter sicerae TaxID=85325 RepID=UPI00156B358B|nr:phage antirepressor KilAC domain-containing protein [Acetobacter sicerae]NHN93634.1 hypothetical protein [Acetobacter sicerae]
MADNTNITTLITPEMYDGELRILDTDLAVRLGFAQPRDIRKIVKRYLPELDKLGTRATVARVINGGNATEYYLNRKQAIFITAKSETATATDITIEIIERFDAYERGEAQPAIPQTYAAALLEAGRLAAEKDQIEAARAAAQARVEELEPQVAEQSLALSRISLAEGSLTVTEAAKVLQLGPRFLFDWLKLKGGKNWLGYEKRVKPVAYLTHKTTVLRQEDGTDKISEQVRITGEGLVKLAKLIPAANIAPEYAHLMKKDAAVPFVPAPEPAS